jgi:hypothetical protein
MWHNVLEDRNFFVVINIINIRVGMTGSFRMLQQVMWHHIQEDRNFSVINIKLGTAGTSRMLQDGMWNDISEDWNFKHMEMFLAAYFTSWPHRNFSP